jgi:serine acetyltransferase
VGVHVGEGASIGAGSICVAPLRIGKWALVAAGSVVTKDVPDFALMKGTPARRVGWVGKHGTRLTQVGESPEVFRCNCGAVYRQTALDTLEET